MSSNRCNGVRSASTVCGERGGANAPTADAVGAVETGACLAALKKPFTLDVKASHIRPSKLRCGWVVAWMVRTCFEVVSIIGRAGAAVGSTSVIARTCTVVIPVKWPR